MNLEEIERLSAKRDSNGLIKVVYDNDPRNRKEAARALGVIGDRAAIPHLLSLMEDPVEEVAKNAKDALIKIGYPLEP